VITEDPHSSAINPIIDKLIVEQPIDFYSDTIADIIGINSPLDYDGKFECIVVSPDTSAYKRVQRFVELITNWFKMSQPSMVIGAKTRGVGEEIQIKLLHGSINPNATDIILIDDICDGGRTFIEMARKLREDKILTNHNLHLVVTHGIFSNGMEVIHQEFKTVYVKNLVVSNKSSFRDVKGVSQISQFRKGVDPNELYWKSEKI
jgi:ribose-phosphate pyrophosphokinase